MIASYLIDLVQQWCVFAMAATVVAFLAREAGFLHVGAAGVMGVGAYTVAILTTRAGIPAQTAILATVPAGLALGGLMHFLLRRLSGDAHALGSLAIGVIAYGIMLNAEGLTGGAMGLAGLPQRPPLTGSNTLDGALLLAASLLFLETARRSPFGIRVNALRDDENLAIELGLKPDATRLSLCLGSSALLALSGGGLAFQLRYVDPSSFTVMESVGVLAMALLFPFARVFAGPLGAAVFIAIPEMLRFVGMESFMAGELRQIIFGVALLGVIVGGRSSGRRGASHA